ncbi:MAG TPA: hypothetical protein VF892_11550, partial [Pseudonocardiaceae bacterium]
MTEPPDRANQATPSGRESRPHQASQAVRAGRAIQAVRAIRAALADLVLPTRCAGCGSPGPALCPPCAGAFNGPFDVHRPLTATGPPVHAIAAYRDTARTVVLAFKERGRRDL